MTTDERTFAVKVLITVKATDETAAREQVDVVLQRAWDTDVNRRHVRLWHFELADVGATFLVRLEQARRPLAEWLSRNG